VSRAMDMAPIAPVADAEACERLVSAAMAGDREAVRALWDMNRRWVAAVLLAYKPSFEDLDDLLQEVAMTFVSKVGTLREETNLRAWLRAVAVNAARAAGRSGKHRPRPFSKCDVREDLLPSSRIEVGADECTASNEESRVVLERLASLPEGYREPLMLRAMHGMKSKLISEILCLPPATIDTRIARARRMLRRGDEVSNVAAGEEIEAIR